jgi:hypothetical protein
MGESWISNMDNRYSEPNFNSIKTISKSKNKHELEELQKFIDEKFSVLDRTSYSSSKKPFYKTYIL